MRSWRRRPQSYILSRLQEARVNTLSDLTANVEDYLEVIYELLQEKGYARSVDISKYLRVKPPSVTSMLKRLDKMGFVVYTRYRGITLTARGEILARSVKERHLVIARFLRILGVDEGTANSDAEGIEHHIHKSTVDHIARFVEFVGTHESWFETFERDLVEKA